MLLSGNSLPRIFIILIISLCCYGLLRCLIVYNSHLENEHDKVNPATIKAIEEFTNLYIYSDFIESGKNKYNENECVICKEEYTLKDEIRKLYCEHYFHSKCLYNIVQNGLMKCPICRNTTRFYVGKNNLLTESPNIKYLDFLTFHSTTDTENE